MALPSLNTPKYSLTIPSTGDVIDFRPFLVKEEKLLLLALETGDESEMTRALEQIVENCTFGAIEVQNLPTFDLEYIFLNIRAKAVGDIIDIKVRCPDDNETYADVSVKVSDIQVEVMEGHDNNIRLTDDIGIMMTYPRIGQMKQLSSLTTESAFGIIKGCVYQIYDSDQVYEDFSEQELDDFLSNLTGEQFQLIEKFFETMPKLRHKVEVTNPETGVESQVVLEGLQSFFA